MADGTLDFSDLYRASPLQRVRLVRDGVPASEVKDMARLMDMPQEKLLQSLGLSMATVNRKAKRAEGLSSEDSERVLGVSNLIGQVQVMVEQSGLSDGFDAAKWLAHWLDQPLPALGGERPADYLDTLEGQRLISSLLAQSQSGAYA
ncbi:antitoxin Xre-like helix-turn-helix domain-containing protein [Asticcacaulis sp. YBE204]|uniref:type II RES/Xre toxin-antitoxin system antitoxin n=1 Tax=Asticcacaulis sp. YBE204 TaxID=1282363 RepID=UPI0003C3D11E|nr:antitoxin Xre-like helix-turn-helix domain-containing protein [Asticcacaulis sp. YBE204]ESQ79093.1 hypothetical protein AEYBE204_11755 [Asticcacaulis sp. YBE204]